MDDNPLGEKIDYPKQLELITNIQQSEAKLATARTQYFVLITSLLIVSLSQFKIEPFQILISLAGLCTSTVWLLTHHRSSSYARYWKSKAQFLSKEGKLTEIYPESLCGIEMRISLYILPIVFIIFWITTIIIILMLPNFAQMASGISNSTLKF